MTWNCEGLSRNLHNIKYFSNLHQVDFIFLSEPQIFQSDVSTIMQYLHGDYKYYLNSDDLLDMDLPLSKSKSHGGTMILWKSSLDPFITVHPVSSSAFLPITFCPPNASPSIHVSVYLPTHGQDSQFVQDLSSLIVCIDELCEQNQDAPVYLRGDFNVNDRNIKRADILHKFCMDLELTEVKISHPTYHHFVGNGTSDSNLDKLMFSNSVLHPEYVKTINCKHENPAVDSHHDLIISSFHLPNKDPAKDDIDNVVAPRVENLRTKIVWSDHGINDYQNIVIPELLRIQQLWYNSDISKTSLSILFESTNNILARSAELTNKTVKLSESNFPKSKPIPLSIRKSANLLKKKHKCLKYALENTTENLDEVREDYIAFRRSHRQLVRKYKAEDAITRDTKTFEILSNNPTHLFKKIKSTRRNKAAKINKLFVGNKTYHEASVPDGFYDSISSLKSRDMEILDQSETFSDYCNDYHNILEICKHGTKIPEISTGEAFDLLHRMKPNVTDFFSITPNHYSYAGKAGWNHFHLLLSLLINNINNATITEVNTTYACILFKGHGKNKNSDRSYRTISSCPVVAKALDLYVRDKNIDSWNSKQSECQFQGEGSSHELAALLVTECIQYSLYHIKQPLYILYLDAKSAFDVVQKELLVRNLFFSGTSGETLLYLNARLANRRTFLDWDGQLMGPIYDEQGLEQGGPNSSEFYKIFSQEHLQSAQKSGLGIPLGPLSISAIGQADDTALVSNNIKNLYFLLHLTNNFCKKYLVNLSSDKTKLQVYHTKNMKEAVDYSKVTNPITVNGKKIGFDEQAEHVGLIRSTQGNLPAILDRMVAHKKALGAVLHTGIARSHRGNPAASVRIHQLYANPVLMTGLGALVLSDSEVKMIDQHHKEVLRNLQRLLPRTPQPVVYFLAGALPGAAHVHLRQLSIFGMITRMPESNILHKHAKNVYNCTTLTSKSWFHRIRELCLLYQLPHPSELMENPAPKDAFKTLVKKRVVDHWENKLRIDAAKLKSLEHFHPQFMSLSSPHPIWVTAASSPTKVVMASIQSLLISGRYRTQSLCSHWSENNSGICKLSETCQIEEDITHFIQHCSALNNTREKLLNFTQSYLKSYPLVTAIVELYCTPESRLFPQFIIDCSVLPEVITAVQINGKDILTHLYNITRIWCYSLHRDRLKILGRWKNFAKV